jgi:phage gpG-like protein
MPEQAHRGIIQGLRMAGRYVENKAKARFGTAGNLKVRTGRLRSSITSSVDQFKLEASVGTNVIYAPIHEYGGVIRPKNKKFLRFRIEGQWIISRQSVIPPRPFLGPALDESVEIVSDIIADEMLKSIARG